MAKDFLTDEEVELEIDRLRNLPAVKLAQREQRCKYQRRQYLYALRWYEKRGKQLMEQGMTFADFRAMPLDDESAGTELGGHFKEVNQTHEGHGFNIKH